jgi:hypothetical protein
MPALLRIAVALLRPPAPIREKNWGDTLQAPRAWAAPQTRNKEQGTGNTRGRTETLSETTMWGNVPRAGVWASPLLLLGIQGRYGDALCAASDGWK